MDLKTYRAPTLAEAVTKIKADLGHNALILHTRQIVERYCFGLRRREIVEIVAGRNLPRRAAPPAKPPARLVGKPSAAPSSSSSSPSSLSSLPLNALGTPSRITAPAATKDALIQTAAASNAVFLDLSDQMRQLRSMVGELAGEVQRQRVPHVPEEFAEHYLNLTANQVDAEIAAEIIKAAHRVIRPEHLGNAEFVKGKLAEQLERLLTTGGPIARAKASGPHVVALIGPTGVGKTTTIAKLAANLKLKE